MSRKYQNKAIEAVDVIKEFQVGGTTNRILKKSVFRGDAGRICIYHGAVRFRKKYSIIYSGRSG